MKKFILISLLILLSLMTITEAATVREDISDIVSNVQGSFLGVVPLPQSQYIHAAIFIVLCLFILRDILTNAPNVGRCILFGLAAFAIVWLFIHPAIFQDNVDINEYKEVKLEKPDLGEFFRLINEKKFIEAITLPWFILCAAIGIIIWRYKQNKYIS